MDLVDTLGSLKEIERKYGSKFFLALVGPAIL
jgi:hypothetical protein